MELTVVTSGTADRADALSCHINIPISLKGHPSERVLKDEERVSLS